MSLLVVETFCSSRLLFWESCHSHGMSLEGYILYMWVLDFFCTTNNDFACILLWRECVCFIFLCTVSLEVTFLWCRRKQTNKEECVVVESECIRCVRVVFLFYFLKLQWWYTNEKISVCGIDERICFLMPLSRQISLTLFLFLRLDFIQLSRTVCLPVVTFKNRQLCTLIFLSCHSRLSVVLIRDIIAHCSSLIFIAVAILLHNADPLSVRGQRGPAVEIWQHWACSEGNTNAPDHFVITCQLQPCLIPCSCWT